MLSRHNKPRQGYCTDTGEIVGKPYKDTDLEMLTDIPAAIFSELFEVAANQEVGWLRILRGYCADTTRNYSSLRLGLRLRLGLKLKLDRKRG